MENSIDGDAPLPVKEGFGLTSIKKRLQTAYGPHASLSTQATGNLFRAELILPLGERRQ
jgi:sensor histidine kinase YesM